MKNIRNILALVLVFFMISCEKDFLDINRDPNVPFDAEIEQLFAGAITSMATAHATGSHLSSALNVYTHQLVARESQDQYGMSASSVLIGNTWNNLYSTVLPNLDAIIDLADEELETIEEGLTPRLTNYGATARILKAFMFTQIVDIWGNVPFTEANKNAIGIIHPVLDADASVYNACFTLMQEGMNMLNANAPGIQGDVIFNGNVNSWKRLANSLMLNMLNKTRLAKGDITGWQDKMTAVLNQDFLEPTEHFEIFFTTSVAPDQRHPGFASGAYAGSQLSQYISPWIYEIMNGLTFNASDNPFAGLADPRVPYYWVNQLTPGSEPDNPWEYKHNNFVTIFFGSIGPYRDMGQDGAASTVGIYPVGGKFDDGEGGRLSISDGTGVAPSKFFTYPDLMFVKAELAHTEGIDFGMPVEEILENAVQASLAHIDHVVNRSGTEQDVPALNDPDNADIQDFVAAVVNRFAIAENDASKLEIIMTQKWIAAFYNGIQNYTDYRRTGFPVLFDPNGISITPNPYEEPEVPTQLTRSYPSSLWYPQRETELNPQIDQKPNQVDAKLFWDKR